MIAIGLSLIFGLSSSFAAPPVHQPFTDLLQRHIVVEGPTTKVRYVDLWRKDLAALDKYLESLSAVTRDDFNKWTVQEKTAFLINAYNGFSLKLIVDSIPDGTPPVSIKTLGSLLTSPWRKKFFNLFGHHSHLESIQNELEALDDPRALLALSCSANGCPPLRQEAFEPIKIEAQLDLATKTFLGDPAKNRFNSGNGFVELSMLFEKEHKSFEKSKKFPGGLQTFLFTYMESAPAPVKEQLKAKQAKLRYLDFDWSLNLAPSLETNSPKPEISPKPAN